MTRVDQALRDARERLSQLPDTDPLLQEHQAEQLAALAGNEA